MAELILKINSATRKTIVLMIFISVAEISKNRVNCNCKYKPCGKIIHTMCYYPETLNKVGSCSGPESVAGMSQPMRHAVLDMHNKIREAVAQGKKEGKPKAANMRKLKWDSELEMIAQRYANSCPPCDQTDRCRDLLDGTKVGQNLGTNWFSYKEKDPKKAEKAKIIVDWWGAEHTDMDAKYIKDISASKQYLTKIIHFVQVVWAETDRVGCGYLEYNYDTKDQQYLLLICNYAVSADVEKKGPVYEEGKPCSKCPKFYRCSERFDGLCTNEKDEFDDVPPEPKRSENLESLNETTTVGWCGGETLGGGSWSVAIPLVLSCVHHAL